MQYTAAKHKTDSGTDIEKLFMFMETKNTGVRLHVEGKTVCF